MLAYVIPFCMALMGVAVTLNVIRLVRGPDMPDRVLALAEGRLVDLRTGQTIWTGSARASSSENNNSNNAGLLGLLVKAIVNQVVNSVSERAHPYAGIASQRLLMAGGNGRILYGPRSLRYGSD